MRPVRLPALLLLLLAAAPARSRAANPPTPAPEPDSPGTVAFVLTDGANVIDFAGPWEVFQDTSFNLYTVSDSRDPVEMTGGLRVVPHHTFADAPAPDIVVVGAQKGSPAMI